MAVKKIPYGTKLPVVLTLKERDIIRDKTLGDPNFGNMGVVEGKNIRLMMSLDDIEDVQGYVAAEANHTDNKLLQMPVRQAQHFFFCQLRAYRLLCLHLSSLPFVPITSPPLKITY